MSRATDAGRPRRRSRPAGPVDRKRPRGDASHTRRAAEYLATTGDRLRRADLVETPLDEVTEILCE